MTIEKIRDNIHHHVGNVISVTYNEGRNKVTRYEGRVIEVYHSIFIILDHDSKRSFSYCDILTETVHISFKV